MVQAIIPVAGLGTRLRPHTFTRPKVLLHVAGKPILAHILDELRSVGIHRIVLVVGYLGDQVRAWVQERYPDLEATFVDQGDPLGNGHAIYVAREYFDEGPVLILFGDTIVRAHLPDLLARPESVAGVKGGDDPHRFGAADCGPSGPRWRPTGDLPPRAAPPAPLLPDAVLIPPVAVSAGAQVTRSVVGPYVSVGRGARISGAVVRDSIVHPGATIEEAVVTSTVIGEGARIGPVSE